MFVGFLLLTAGMIGLATIQPDDSTSAVVFNGLAGLGFGGPLVLIVAGVHLSTPHHLIATATAVTTSARAVAATVFTASYSAAFNNRLAVYLPQYISQAALGAGLPASSVPGFVSALSGTGQATLGSIPGITPAVTAVGTRALRQAYADGLRVVFIIGAPFGALACVMCFFLGDMSKTMNYMVEAPVEALRHKRREEVKV